MAHANDALIEGVAGAIGAVIALTSTYPLLTVSTLRALEHKDDGSGEKQLQGRLRLLPGPIQDVIEFTRQHSWRALFAGLRPAVVATATSQGVYHTVYSMLRQMAVAHQMAALRQQAHAKQQQYSPSDGGKSVGISVGASMLVASVAGMVNVMLTNPIWVVITQMQALSRQRPGMSTLSVVRQMYTDQGLGGFFKGLAPSMIMVINPTIQYILYESLVARALEWQRSRRAAHAAPRHAAGPAAAATAAAAAVQRHAGGAAAGGKAGGMALGALDIFVLSALAKIGATLVTYPLLVVKNRLQSINRHTREDMKYTGVLDAVKRMLADEGLGGFYKGMRVKLLQTVLAAALLMMLKEELFTATRQLLNMTAPAGSRRRIQRR
ncbi:hypothetical protein OEZ86_014462 [Tetradesmus obliquus]|nr:hypothetical protein OEZ86_014462 [Tetradesmus obliquus]